jgi:uncharacterized membrane protein YgcG
MPGFSLPQKGAAVHKTLAPLVAFAVVSPLFAVSACMQVGAGDQEEVQAVQADVCAPTQVKPTAVVASAAPKQAASKAIDGNTGTRWESAYSDPQWLYVDLGAVKTFTEVKIDWQHAAAKDYRIDVSNDAVTWSAPIATRTGGLPVDHRIDDITGLSASARYVRIYGLARATVYGYSIWELYIYNGSSCGTGGTGGGGTGGGGTAGGGTGGGGTAGGGAGGGTAGSTGGGVCASNDLTTSTTLPVTVSSVTGTGAGARAFDNNAGTRWESGYSDPQWIRVDLGSVKTINRVRIDWQHAAARDYHIDISNDGTTWSAPVVSKVGMAAIDHRIDDLGGFTVTGRYVRMSGTARATAYGYSIWEMDVYGDNSATCANGAANLLTTGWDQATVASNFTPLTGFSFDAANKNAISFDYTGTTYATSILPSLLEFTQTITIPTAGSTWRLTFTITGINDQTNLPPRFIGSLDDSPAQVFSPSTTTVGGGTKLVRVGTLDTGTQLSMDFSASESAGAVVPLVIDNVPIFTESADNTSGVGLQKFKVTDATLVKIN